MAALTQPESLRAVSYPLRRLHVGLGPGPKTGWKEECAEMARSESIRREDGGGLPSRCVCTRPQ
eukprot:387138-Rhodomonas_salina.2